MNEDKIFSLPSFFLRIPNTFVTGPKVMYYKCEMRKKIERKKERKKRSRRFRGRTDANGRLNKKSIRTMHNDTIHNRYQPTDRPTAAVVAVNFSIDTVRSTMMSRETASIM